MHGGDGKQRRDRHALGAQAPVREDDDVHAIGDGVVGLVADPLDGDGHARRAVGDRPGDVDRARVEDVVVDLAQLLELVVADDRLVHHELVRMLGRLGEQVALGAHAGAQAHHDQLADRVDRRVGHLREELLEVGEERRLAVGHDRERRVVAHRADRLLGVGGHRRQQHPQVLLGVAEGELARAQRLGARDQRLLVGQVVEMDRALAEPLGVWPARRDLVLGLGVVDDPAAVEVDEEEVAGLQAALALDVLDRDRQHAGLRGEHDPAVVRLQPAAGAQAVAVERRADHAAVGERHRRRAVPRLHEAGVVGVEALEVVGQVVPAGVGLGDHHHHRVRQRAAAEGEQLEHVVERRRVRARGPYDGDDLLDVVAEELGGQLRLARAHPVGVAAQRVDLAVVGDHPVRVRELPAGEGVCGVARVHEAQRALGPLVVQVGVEAVQLEGDEHPLVDDGPRGEARDHEVRAGGALGHAADHVELALEGVVVAHVVGGADEELADLGPGRVGRVPRVVGVDGHVAPAQHVLALLLDRVLEQSLELGPLGGVLAREEADRDAVAPRWRQVVDDRPQELVGHLDEDPGAVAGLGVGALRPAMLQVLERRDRAPDRLVAARAVQARHEGDAARVVLVGWVVEADGLWH